MIDIAALQRLADSLDGSALGQSEEELEATLAAGFAGSDNPSAAEEAAIGALEMVRIAKQIRAAIAGPRPVKGAPATSGPCWILIRTGAPHLAGDYAGEWLLADVDVVTGGYYATYDVTGDLDDIAAHVALPAAPERTP